MAPKGTAQVHSPHACVRCRSLFWPAESDPVCDRVVSDWSKWSTPPGAIRWHVGEVDGKPPVKALVRLRAVEVTATGCPKEIKK
eukprot:gene19410-biopygen6979